MWLQGREGSYFSLSRRVRHEPQGKGRVLPKIFIVFLQYEPHYYISCHASTIIDHGKIYIIIINDTKRL